MESKYLNSYFQLWKHSCFLLWIFPFFLAYSIFAYFLLPWLCKPQVTAPYAKCCQGNYSLLNEELQLSFWCHSENVQLQLKIKVICPLWKTACRKLVNYFHEKLLCSISAYCCNHNQNFSWQSIPGNEYSWWLSWKSIYSLTGNTNCFSPCVATET